MENELRNKLKYKSLISPRSLITNLTCPGDSSLYVEWAQPEQFYHGVDRSERAS